MNARISIIIPVYNIEQQLRRCLDSIIVQTYKAFECILIDDGSIDNSGHICDEYAQKDNRFHVIHCSNRGPSYARNKGLDYVKTKWVTFVDADDYIHPQYIENFLNYCTEEITTQIIQGYHCYGYNGEDKDTLYHGTTYIYNEIYEGNHASYIEKNNILYNWAVWCKLFSIEIIRNNHLEFEEAIWCGEDGLFWHKYLCYVKKIIFIPERGYIYYCPRNYCSVSRSGKYQLSTSEWLILAENYKYISDILPTKFKFSHKYTTYLRMFYLNNYFKALLKSPNLSLTQIEYLQTIRPSKKNINWTMRGLIYWLINLFPIPVIRKFVLLRNKCNSLLSTYSTLR